MKINMGVVLTVASAAHAIYHAITGKPCIIKMAKDEQPEVKKKPE